MTSPIMPPWNDLKDNEKNEIMRSWGTFSCEHSDHGNVCAVYEDIRKALMKTERLLSSQCLEPVPSIHWHLKKGLWQWYV